MAVEQYHAFNGGPLSNFFTSPFTLDGITFCCGEQWMMYVKATIFKDDGIKAKLLAEKNPRKLKALGRKIKNFDEDIWNREGLESGELRRGWLEKFKQNSVCLKELEKTKGKKIVEASSWDTKWGIGLSPNDPRVQDQKQWRGLNLLGKELDKIHLILCKPNPEV